MTSTSRWPATATSAASVEPLGTPDAGLARDLPGTGARTHREASSRRPTHHVELTRRKLDALAATFLGSEFTGQVYANWPIDRRVHAYLRHNALMDSVNDGDACNAVLECVMTNIGRAQRDGRLRSPHDRNDHRHLPVGLEPTAFFHAA